MKIGTLDLGSRPVFLAPMEDVTDIGFRLLCRRMGAAMVYSEFVAADALVRMVNKSLKKLEVCDEERPVAIQIYGKEPEPMAEAARIVVEQAHPDVLDLNFGCPVKKIATKGAGAGMLRNVPKLLEITRAVVDAVGSEVPVTVKTRLGWDKENLIITELAEQLQDCGISALTIHGRTRSQLYSDQADWTLIGEVKRNPRMNIPIIGNGDITSAERAVEAFERYGVDAIMVGRATFGRPWIFREIVEKGLDQRALLAGINRFEFKYREANYGFYPKGLIYGLNALDTWLYNEDAPFINLELGEAFAFLRAKMDQGYFEELLRKHFLENPHKAVVVMTPEPGLTEKMAEELRQKLDTFAKSLTKEERQQIVDDLAELRKWQETPSAKEDVEKIPMLRREDLSREVKPFVNRFMKAEVRGAAAVPETLVVAHPLNTSGIDYLTYMFDI